MINVLGISCSEILSEVRAYNPGADLSLIEKAYHFAENAHLNQVRVSGEPFFVHPVSVAKILISYRLDVPTIVAGLLHDAVEDTAVTKEDVVNEFGAEIAQLVEGVTKLTSMSKSAHQKSETGIKGREDNQAENIRKVFLAMAKDIRVILIKLADRLHNLRTLSPLSSNKQHFIAQETLEIYAPLTHRLGLWHMMWEMEDLAFRYLDPEAFHAVQQAVDERIRAREMVILEAVETLKEKLAQADIPAEIEGRSKHLYSIHQKMARKGKELPEIYDLQAVRVLVQTVEHCYAVLGVTHGLWMPLPDRIKDYIAKPKSNHYRSLHTTVYGPGGEPLEIQIRTREMHMVAEYGIAAHWNYKEGVSAKDFEKQLIPWVKQLLDWQTDIQSAKDYIQALKIDLLQSQVFVFTPKGDVVDLPTGSTPIDFAYRIHTDVGHRCVGAKANGKLVPLDYQLQTGDIAEVVTTKIPGGPSRDWLNICKTSQAKHKIRAWFKKEKREESIQRGKELLEKELRRHRMEDGSSLKSEALEKVRTKMRYGSMDDFLAAIGFGEVALSHVVLKLKEEMHVEHLQKSPVSLEPKQLQGKKKDVSGINVKDLGNIMVRFSKCCNPLPGDPVAGYVTIGKGVSVHRHDCPNMKYMAQTPERMIEVSWDQHIKDSLYTVELEVEAWDRPGLLGDVMATIYDEKIVARNCRAWARREKALIKLVVEVYNLPQLQHLMKQIQKVRDVIHVGRVTHSSAEALL